MYVETQPDFNYVMVDETINIKSNRGESLVPSLVNILAAKKNLKYAQGSILNLKKNFN